MKVNVSGQITPGGELRGKHFEQGIFYVTFVVIYHLNWF